MARILIVEDEDAVAGIVAYFLRKAGHTPTVAAEGATALREASARPDLILLDLRLPRIDGLEVLKDVKNDPDLHTIPVVVLTTSATEQDVLRARRLQADSYITKPVEAAQLLDVVRTIESFSLLVVAVTPVSQPGETIAAGQ